jgi:hypothetical protein
MSCPHVSQCPSIHNQSTHEELVQEALQEINLKERLVEQVTETAMLVLMLMQPKKPESTRRKRRYRFFQDRNMPSVTPDEQDQAVTGRIQRRRRACDFVPTLSWALPAYSEVLQRVEVGIWRRCKESQLYLQVIHSAFALCMRTIPTAWLYPYALAVQSAIRSRIRDVFRLNKYNVLMQRNE